MTFNGDVLLHINYVSIKFIYLRSDLLLIPCLGSALTGQLRTAGSRLPNPHQKQVRANSRPERTAKTHSQKIVQDAKGHWCPVLSILPPRNWLRGSFLGGTQAWLSHYAGLTPSNPLPGELAPGSQSCPQPVSSSGVMADM